MNINRIIYSSVLTGMLACFSIYAVPCVPEAATVGETIWHIADRLQSVIAGSEATNILRQADLPIVISAPGYYVFGEDIISAVPTAITINASVPSVWIDMNGHTLTVQNANATGEGISNLGGQCMIRNGRIILQNVNNANADNAQACITYPVPTGNFGDPHIENIQLMGDVNSISGVPYGVGIALSSSQAGTIKHVQGRTFSVGIFSIDTAVSQETLFYECIIQDVSSEGFRLNATDQPFIATLVKCISIPADPTLSSFGFDILSTPTLTDQSRPAVEFVDCIAMSAGRGFVLPCSDAVLRNCKSIDCAFNAFDLLQTSTGGFGGSGSALIECSSFVSPIGIYVEPGSLNSLVYKCVVERSASDSILIGLLGPAGVVSNAVVFGNQVISRPLPAISAGISVSSASALVLDNFVKDNSNTNYIGSGIPTDLLATTDLTITTTANYWYNVNRS